MSFFVQNPIMGQSLGKHPGLCPSIAAESRRDSKLRCESDRGAIRGHSPPKPVGLGGLSAPQTYRPPDPAIPKDKCH